MSYAARKRGKVQSIQAQEARRAAEEQARAEAAARRRRRLVLVWGSAAAVLVVAAAITVVQVQAAQARDRLRGPANMMSDGLVVYGDTEELLSLATEANGPDRDATATGDTRFLGIADLKLYVDYTDAEPAEFWAANGETLSERMIDGDVTLEIHPIGDDEASIAAAAAFACVAEKAPDSGLAAHGALLAAQDSLLAAAPDELPAVLRTALADGGVDDEGVGGCVDGERFRPWVEDATERAAESTVYPQIGPVTGSALFVLDLPYGGAPDDTEDFMAAVEAAVASVSPDTAADTEADTEAGTEAGEE